MSILACGCSASSEPKLSGDVPDASQENDAAVDSGLREASVVDATLDTGDGYDGPPPPVFTLDAGVTWTALYRDYFGNDPQLNTAGCSNGSFCHGAADAAGGIGSGYVCPAGDKNACYTSLTSQLDGGALLVTPDASFQDDYLSNVLCAVNDAGEFEGSGTMPMSAITGGCAYFFTPSDVARIRQWIQAGYPND